MTQQALTPEAARSFDRESVAHIEALAQVSDRHGCTCTAYVDYFTYRRWQAQGMQVQKGEHGTRLGIFYTKDETDKAGNTTRRSYPGCSFVFCRCQVAAKD